MNCLALYSITFIDLYSQGLRANGQHPAAREGHRRDRAVRQRRAMVIFSFAFGLLGFMFAAILVHMVPMLGRSG
ncbi:hypothetical protein [Agrobacterium rosae]|uniref:hypothetical protein n=1 Tax=Agrobacterium rosae TaxID=1972867 RepID=UPI003A80EEE5